MTEVMNDREQEIVDMVARALGNHLVVANPVKVHTSDGGEASALRFTMDDLSSTDVRRERIAAGEEAPSVLARAIEEDLLKQIGQFPS